jgi:hypothetical protein
VTPIPPAIKTACSELNIRLDAVPNGPSIEIYMNETYKMNKDEFFNKFNNTFIQMFSILFAIFKLIGI